MTQRKSVFVISTGGTIGMLRTDQGYAPLSGHLEKSMAKIPELQNADMPHYTVYEYAQPIDSANMTPSQWVRIGEDILKNYAKYDGFVVLHGTDTMSYTASALSFMLENLKKPVILTGSQLPLFETRNDARENLINAILIAGNYAISDVCIYFNNKLFRGNRSKKIDASSFDAFASPNFPVLGKIGTEIRIRTDLKYPRHVGELQLQPIESVAIGTMKLFPGMGQEFFQAILKAPLQGLVLETYGVGNAPQDDYFLKAIGDALARNMVIVNCSQCDYAKVRMSEYASGTALMQAGVVSGGDMTIEAAVTKLFYLFSKKLSIADIKMQMMKNLRGELTV